MLRDDLTTRLDDDGPTPEELAAIEAEWPLIEAEMDLLYAEIGLIDADPHPTPLDWHRMRRAEALVMRELVKLQRPTDPAGRRPLLGEVA
jgi:hypothetical protein